MNADPLTQVLLQELYCLYDAEEQVLKTLPAVADKAFAPVLKKALEMHTGQMRHQLQRLEASAAR